MSTDLARRGPDLGESMSHPTLVGDDWYPAANEVTELDVLEEWLEKADQALVDTRNGVIGILWPLAVGGVFALVSIWDELFGPVGLALFAAWSWVIVILVMLFMLFREADGRTTIRRSLLQVRAGYVRRRHQLRAARSDPGTRDQAAIPARQPILRRLVGSAFGCLGASSPR